LNVLIIGAGAWGTTLTGLVDRAGHNAILYGRNQQVVTTLRHTRRHPVSLPNFVLPDAVAVTDDWAWACDTQPDVVVMAVSTAGVEMVADMLAEAELDSVIVSATKGIDPETLLTASSRVGTRLERADRISALSGPNLAVEIAQGLPAASVVASTSIATAKRVQSALMSPTFRMYTSLDLLGVELAGALKNVIAIGAGIGDGLNAGNNARAAFLTRGVAEMTRLGVACGANSMTFAGLAGIGDLMATCGSTLSRNHTVGARIARGERLDSILGDMREVAEGVPTTRAAIALAARHGVEMPIATEIGHVLFDGFDPHEAIARLMARDATSERS